MRHLIRNGGMIRRAICPGLGLCVLLSLSVSPGQQKGQRTFTGLSLQEIAFPIGGIGTGSISLGGRGDLRDWEIFNKPNKGSRLPYTFFAIWAQQANLRPVARVLERQVLPPYRGDDGVPQSLLSGLPRLQEGEFKGEYPFASIKFKDASLPVKVELEAWNPFIPLDVDDSALPLAFFAWRLTNPSSDTVHVSIAASLWNPIGDRYTNVKGERPGLGGNVNEYKEATDVRGLFLYSNKVKPDDPNYGSMCLATTWKDLDAVTRWYRGGWWDQCHVFWDDFSDNGRVKNVRDTLSSDEGRSDVGSIILHAAVPPHGSVTLPVAITWYFPNRENYWNGDPAVRGKMMKNHVARMFGDAWGVAEYFVKNESRLESQTRAFHDALFSSTLPPSVLDAVSSQMSTLKTNVGILLQDGSFFGFEGNSDHSGCCPMNCTHVWNYEQALAFLFPQLERSMRETSFLHNTLPNGYMTFRTLIPLGDYWWKFKACADGQNGEIVRAYRDWRVSGDNEWLRKLWPDIKRALEFAWKGCGDPPPKGFEWTKEQVSMPWDPDKNGVMEGEQHNTYDIEFYGPNTMTGSLYLAALKAASEMATAMGEPDKAQEYLGLFKEGSGLYDKQLWGKDYYVQDVYVLKGLRVPKELISPENEDCGADCECKVTPGDKKPALDTTMVDVKYQYGTGCLSDQLLGQYLAHAVGLGYVLNPSHVRTAAKSIFTYNFKKQMADFANVQRVYALNDEAGLLLCSWPHGNRPELPFVYSDEVWTGIEYQVAAELIYDGSVKEGLQIVKAVRDRYNGLRRNPWDEVECGHHYARAMSSWAVLLALTGYHCDGPGQRLDFAPVVAKENFKTFWSTGTGWGEMSQTSKGGARNVGLRMEFGSLQLRTLAVEVGSTRAKSVRVMVDGKPVPVSFTFEEGKTLIHLKEPAQLRQGSLLTTSLH
jgi:non-lysosomal glucosylceramidase